MVTVVIPTYNRGEMVARAIRSVLRQSCAQFEVIVVDDGSTDETEALVRGFQDERVRFIRHAANAGVSAARNTGVRNASAPWVVFLDSDDEFLPTMLERVSEAIASAPSEVGFLWCGFERVREYEGQREVLGQQIWTPSFDTREDAYRHALKDRHFGPCSCLGVRVSAFWSVGGFDEKLDQAEDADLLLRLVRAYDFTVVAEVLVTYHHHYGDRVSRASVARALGYRAVLEKYREDIMADREAAHDFYSRIWACYYGSGHYAIAQRYGLRAVWKRPESLQSWIRLGKSFVAPVLKS